MTAEPLTDAHQELRERIKRLTVYGDVADAVLALLDEPTLHALLGLRQVGWQAPLSRLLHDDPRRTPPAGFVPVYVKEAPDAR